MELIASDVGVGAILGEVEDPIQAFYLYYTGNVTIAR